MDAEEKLFEQRFGKKQPFTVPDGYFDQLAERVMERLPEQQPASVPQVSVEHKWRRWAVAAAAVGVVLTGSLAFMGQRSVNEGLVTTSHRETATTTTTTDAYSSSSSYSSLDMAADYAMLDNDEIYAMVSENQ